MSRQVLATSTGGDFVLAQPGLYPATCIDVIDLGMVNSEMYGAKHKIRLVFVTSQIKEDGTPITVRQTYNLSLHDRSTLGKHLVSWRSKPFTPQEKQGFDIERLVGAAAYINIVHVTKGENTYANVDTIMRLPAELKAPMVPPDYVREMNRQPSIDIGSPYYQPKEWQLSHAAVAPAQHQQAPPPQQQAYQQPLPQQQLAGMYAQGQPQPALAANNGQHTQALYGNGQPVNNGQPAQAQQAGNYGFDPDADLPF